MTQHFDYCPSASEGDNQSVGSSAPVVSRCFPGGCNVKLYISRGRLAWWLLAFFAQWTHLIHGCTVLAVRLGMHVSVTGNGTYNVSSRMNRYMDQLGIATWFTSYIKHNSLAQNYYSIDCAAGCGVFAEWYMDSPPMIETWISVNCGVIAVLYMDSPPVIETWILVKCGVVAAWYMDSPSVIETPCLRAQ